jgi:hypothetical protein
LSEVWLPNFLRLKYLAVFTSFLIFGGDLCHQNGKLTWSPIISSWWRLSKMWRMWLEYASNSLQSIL